MSFEKIKLKYVATFANKKKELTDAWKSKNTEKLHGLLHKLTGSSGGYGFDDLCAHSRKATEITRDAQSCNDNELDKRMQNILELLQIETDKMS